MIEISDLTKSLIQQYGNELFFRNFEEKVSNWMLNVSTKEEKELLVQLLAEFKFYSRRDIKNFLHTEMDKLRNKTSDFEDAHLIPMISNNRRYNGANELIHILNELDREFEFLPYKDTLINDPQHIRKDNNTIIILDDIAGTGGTLRKFLKANKKFLKGKKVLVIFIVATQTAIDKFESIVEEFKDFELDISYCNRVNKVEETSLYFKEQNLERMKKIEEGIWGRDHNNILGYKDSQLLIGFTHNIPNNTISAMWYHPDFKGVNKNWNSLFKRYTKKTKRDRSQQNYSNRKG